MAFKRFTIDGYGQLELNNVAFRRDGRVEAQCFLDETDFADVPAENGMLLAVDRVNRTVKFATDDSLPIALNYTAEKDFKLERGTFLPRLGYLSVGDLFTTNCFGYDADFADDAAVKAVKLSGTGAVTVYGGISEEGAILLTKTAPEEGPVLKAVEVTTMPDGTTGIKFQVLTA